MDFQTIDFDELTDEMESDEALDLAQKFQTVQEDNLAEFEDASEEIDALEGRVTDFKDAALGDFSDEEELTEAVADAGPLGVDELADFKIARKQDLLTEFSTEETDEEEADETDDANFSDMGQHGETHDEEEANKEFAEKYLGNIDGLSL